MKVMPIISLILMSTLFMGLLAVPTVLALDWSINIDPTASGEFQIFAGSATVISATGPTDENVFVEIINANTSNTILRFPETGFTPLVDGVAIITWDIPLTFPLGVYYVSLTDSIGSVRGLISFSVQEPGTTPPGGDPTHDTTINEILQDIIRLDSWRQGFERAYLRTIQGINTQLQYLWVLMAITIVLGVFAVLGAFKDRIPALKALFKGDEEEKEDETHQELRKLIRFVVRREIPTEFGHMFDEEWWEQIVAKKGEDKVEDAEPVAVPEEKKVKVAETVAVKKQKVYKRKCGYRNCGRTFLAKHPAALYCPDRNCRILEFKAKKRDNEKAGKDE